MPGGGEIGGVQPEGIERSPFSQPKEPNGGLPMNMVELRRRTYSGTDILTTVLRMCCWVLTGQKM